MATTGERLQILKMVETGQITAEEAAKLLAATEEATPQEEPPDATRPARWFRVNVTDMRTGRTKANLNIPLGLADVGLRMGAKFAPEMGNVDLAQVRAAVKQGTQGKILEVDDEMDNEHVVIYIE